MTREGGHRHPYANFTRAPKKARHREARPRPKVTHLRSGTSGIRTGQPGLGAPWGTSPPYLGVASRGSRGPGRTTPSTAWGHLPFSQLCLGFGTPCPNAPRIRSLSPHPGRLPQATQEGLKREAEVPHGGGGGTGSTVLRATGSARAKENRKCLSGKISPSPPGSKWDTGSQVPAAKQVQRRESSEGKSGCSLEGLA